MTILFYSTWSSSEGMVIKIHDMGTLHYTGPFFFSSTSYFSLLIGLLMLCTKHILQLILRALTWEGARAVTHLQSLQIIV